MHYQHVMNPLVCRCWKRLCRDVRWYWGDIPSLREIWGDAAVFVPPDDREVKDATASRSAIANAINTLISDSSLCTALGTKSRTRALELTPQRMVLGYLEAYKDLIAQRQ